jgi:hypothetical protein
MGLLDGPWQTLSAMWCITAFNSADLWHSGTLNYSPARRLAVTAGFAPGAARPWACA